MITAKSHVGLKELPPPAQAGKNGDRQQETLKIGEVATRLDVSIRTIHMYEREGLFIAYKNAAGTRYFNEEDITWLQEVRKMIKTGIGIAGIRRLLSLIPCWNYKGCAFEARQKCPVNVDETAPCWANKNNQCAENSQECRQCPVYEMRFCVSTMKRFLDIRFKPEEHWGKAVHPVNH